MVEAYPVVLEGLRSVVASDPALELVGTASSAEACIDLANELDLDVVLVDLDLPDMSGVDLIRRLRQKQLASEIVAFSARSELPFVLKALEAGASSYLTTDCSMLLLLDALKGAVWGGAVVEKAVLSAIVGRAMRVSLPEDGPMRGLLKQLTARETDVLQLLAQGRRNSDICRLLCLAPVTVKKHIATIVGKLGVEDRTQAALVGAHAFGVV